MSPRSIAVASKSKLLIYTAAPLLVIYLILLLGTTFYSQRQLHKAAQQSLHAELEKHASALSYFYSERRADIRRMAEDRDLMVFFSNRALGMSMEYGLRASLLGMRALAKTMVDTRTIGRLPIYQRIVIEDVAGEMLVDEGAAAGQPAFWKPIAQPLPATPQLLVSEGRMPRIYLVATVSNKGTPVANIIAQVDRDTVISGLGRRKDDAEDYVVTLARAAASELAASGLDSQFEHRLASGRKDVGTESIVGTPFEIAFVGDGGRIGGVLASMGYFFALAFLAIALLLVLGLMAWQIQQRERALIASHDQLAESNERLRTSQKQLVQSEKMASLGTLAAGVAHEINNPIGFIQGNLTNLRDYHAVLMPLISDFRALTQARAETEPELLRRWEERLQGEDLDFLLEDMDSLMTDTIDGGRRVAEIVSGLRSFSHGGESLEEPVDINDCVAAALSLASNELRYKAEVEQHLGEVQTIRGNPGQITQVLLNLLVNAAQAIEEKGKVSIETLMRQDALLVRVTDTGRGISPEHMGQLFTPFFTTKEVGAGTGLGLSISQGIIESHGGSIHAESGPGRGSVFIVTLPLPVADAAQVT